MNINKTRLHKNIDNRIYAKTKLDNFWKFTKAIYKKFRKFAGYSEKIN